MRIAELILNAIYPEGITCNRCGGELIDKDNRHLGFCISCQSLFCKCEEEGKVVGCEVYSLFTYESVRDIILRCKDQGMSYLTRSIGRMMAEYYLQKGLSADIIAYVPGSRKNTKRRGYDHMKWIAKEFGKETGLPVAYGMKRVRESEDQTRVGAQERYRNVRGSFVFDGMEIERKRVILLDDVITTGATLSACVMALKSSFPSQVMCLTLGKA